MRDSFIFYRSFFEASNALNDADKLELLDAICEFGLNLNETKTKPMVSAMFSLIKPQLAANAARYENGKKGGRPKTKTKPRSNLTKTKAKPNVNVNGNVNGNEKEKKPYKENAAPSSLTEGDFPDFWLPCLKKVARPAALQAWKRMRKEKRTDLTALELVERYNKAVEVSAAEKNGSKKFAPHPSTWLNQDRWNDEIEEPPKKFPFTLPQMEEGGYSGAIYPDLRGQRFYMEPREGGKVFDENGNELNLIESDGEGYVAPRLCGTK